MDTKSTENVITALEKGKKQSTIITKAIGCSIKPSKGQQEFTFKLNRERVLTFIVRAFLYGIELLYSPT
ncbi:hypothetical protein DNU06_13795 [Putridiphycobacter roseus]|uniref:Uncharacterized protein n=1 Tax=Putridiphycobacter roseus TaxID=2219161 RepID=A0A2W1NDP8_9FLAO|nr:hypothetical protein [Putridiphycobacter roseus]PZE16196.1 hypothetical protein DNU06_13795 [Putridiphycobacter roseus]